MASVSCSHPSIQTLASASETSVMSQPSNCQECGSSTWIESGVFEHGTWIRTLTCWTCTQCRTIIAVPEEASEDVLLTQDEPERAQR